MKNRLSFFCSRIMFIGIGLSYLLNLSKTTILLAMILGTFINYLLIDKFKSKNNPLLIFILLIYLGTITCNLCHTLYLENTSLSFIIFFTMFIPFMISFIRREAFIKLSDNLFKCSLLIFSLTIISLIPYVDINNIRPIKLPNISNLMKATILFSASSLTPAILLGEADRTHNLIGNITTIILTFLIISVLGLKEACFYRYPEYVVLKRISFLDFISNVDNIFFFIILVDLTIGLSLCYNKLIKDNRKYNITLFFISIIIVNIIAFHGSLLNSIYNLFPYYTLFLLVTTILLKKRKYK